VVGALAGAYVYVQAGLDAEHAATADASFAARKAADQLSSSLDFLRKTNAAIVSDPAFPEDFATGKCDVGYGPIGVFDTGHIDVIRLDGSVVCSSLSPAPAGKVFAGQPWLEAETPVIAAPVTDSETGKRVAVVSDRIGNLGVIAWFVDLEPVGPKLSSQFGSGVDKLDFMVLAGRPQSIVMRSTGSSRWTGASVAGTPFVAPTGPADSRDVDGTARLYGSPARVGDSGWTVYVGADKAAATASASALQQRLLLIIAFGLLAVLLALLFVYRQVARPIDALSAGVRSSRGLDFTAAVPVQGPRQVATLGDDINNLIASLKRELGERISAQHTYARLFEASPLPMTVTDPQTGRFTDANDAAVKAFGYSREELRSIEAVSLYAPGGANEESARQEMRDLQATDYLRLGPISLRKKDGSIVRALVAAYQVDYAGATGWVAIYEDVTEREKIEKQHEQAQRLESLGQLAGGVAHDFNNLLAVILNVTADLKSAIETGALQAADKAEMGRDLARVDKAAQSASRLTKQLLAFARRQVVQPLVLDVNAEIRGLTELLRRTLGSHIRLVVTLPDSLWPVVMDAGHLEQIVINLAVNSRDAMPRGGDLSISTSNVTADTAFSATRSGLKPGRYVQVEVADSGTGMDKATLDHIFEPFFTTKGPGHGTGLGLATIYGIVKQLGGYVTVDSDVGRGTTVTVLLPATDQPVTARPEPRPMREGAAGATVLVVEDYEDLRELIGEILRGAGYQVISARDGAEALRLSREHEGEIEVLLTDIVMPNMLGPDLADRMKAENPSLRVLFMSGHAQPVLGAQPMLSPETPLLQKPFLAPELFEKLSEVLGGRPAQKAT
jgi:PAS domain S-box-containing protein